MNPFILYPIIAYGVGFFAAWIIAARKWIGDFGSGDTLMAGAWGFLIAIMWPIFLVAFGIGKLATIGLR